MKSLFLLCSFILAAVTVRADFLIVQRNGNLRESSSTASEILEKIRKGDTLLLVSTDQVDGYYHVISMASHQQGFVYHTLVRKVAGEPDQPPVDVDAVVDIRVLDVGAGLCTLIKLPGNKFVIYDAGGGDALAKGDSTLKQIKEYIPPGSDIELMVLSHTDADHITAAGKVIRDYHVKKVLWGGYEGSMIDGDPTGSFIRLRDALQAHPEVINVNLHEEHDSIITPGNSFMIGAAKFTFLCGFGQPLEEWHLTDRAEKLNAVSIIMKLTFGGRSVLFCGDAVGRHREDPEDSLIATEKFLLENADPLLSCNVLIAPHHGAKNGSSKAFVEKLQPEYVIFSAGHKFSHPTTRTATQYLRFTTVSKIFRTDRGDDEHTATEWSNGRIANCSDKFNDDSIQIQLRSNGTFRVYYLLTANTCN